MSVRLYTFQILPEVIKHAENRHSILIINVLIKLKFLYAMAIFLQEKQRLSQDCVR